MPGGGQRAVPAPLPGEADPGAAGGDGAVPPPAGTHLPAAAGPDCLRALQLPGGVHHVPDPLQLRLGHAEHRQLADASLDGA